MQSFFLKKVRPINIPALLLTTAVIANLFSRNLPEYSFYVIILVTSYWGAISKKAEFSWKKLDSRSMALKYLIFFALAIFLSFLVNNSWGIEQIRDLLQFVWILGLYCTVLMIRAARFPRNFLEITCYFLIFLSIALILHFFLFPPDQPSSWGLPNRLRGAFTNTNFLSHSYFILFTFIFSLFISSFGQGKKTLLLGIASFMLALVLLLTFNRSAYLASLFALPFIVFIKRKIFAGIMLVALLSCFSLLFLTDFGGFSRRINRTFDPVTLGDSARWKLWEVNVMIFKENPIFGVGYYNNTRDVASYYKKFNIAPPYEKTHAHSEILSFLAGTGIIGFLAYLSLFYIYSKLAIRSLKVLSDSSTTRRGLLIGALTTQPAFLILGLADNNFEIHTARYFLMLSWAIISAEHLNLIPQSKQLILSKSP